MRAVALVMAFGVAGLSASSLLAGSLTVPVTIKVRLAAPAERGSCKSSHADGRVTCESQPLGLTTLEMSQQWGSRQTARLGSGSDAYWKVGDSAEAVGGEGPYGAYATSRVVTYGGMKFVELTLNW